MFMQPILRLELVGYKIKINFLPNIEDCAKLLDFLAVLLARINDLFLRNGG